MRCYTWRKHASKAVLNGERPVPNTFPSQQTACSERSFECAVHWYEMALKARSDENDVGAYDRYVLWGELPINIG